MTSQLIGRSIVKVIVITESAFGNTRAVAERLAAGAREAGASVEVLAAAEAPDRVPEGTDLIVLAAPTHNLGRPSAASRRQAVERGGAAVETGVREWIERAEPAAGVPVLCVSTVVSFGRMLGSAARAAAKKLGRRFGPVQVSDFRVTGTPPVLVDGEAERAEATGRAIVRGEPLPPPSGAAVAAPAVAVPPRVRRPCWRRWWTWTAVLALGLVAATTYALLSPNPMVGDRGKLAITYSAENQQRLDTVTVTRAELAAANGTNGRVWIAVDGVVYDLSGVEAWADGEHHGVRAGTDATEQFVGSPHGASKLQRVPVVGRLKG